MAERRKYQRILYRSRHRELAKIRYRLKNPKPTFLTKSEKLKRLQDYQRKYRQSNREKIRQYQLKNKEQIRAWKREYDKSEKMKSYKRKRSKLPQVRSQRRNYLRQKSLIDEKYQLSRRLRSRIRAAIKFYGGKKASLSIDLLGCSIEKARAHIQSLFTPNMTWEKFMTGEIHLDHKLPCSSFDLTDPEQQKLCFHYTNLQPLWWRDNLAKGNKILCSSEITCKTGESPANVQSL